MAAPLLALLTGTVGRLLASGAARMAARGAASPGNAKSALSYVGRFARQQSAKRVSRFARSVSKRAPGLAQAKQWKTINRAFGQLQRARSAKASALQIGDPLKVLRAEEREAAAKEKLAKASQALIDSFKGLGKSVISAVIALHTIPYAVQALGRARVESIRGNSMYAGRTAGAIARYDVNERLNQMSTARFTSASDTRVISATQDLTNELKPLTDAISVLYNEGLVVLLRSIQGGVSLLRTFSPLVAAIERIAKHFSDSNQASGDLTARMMQGMIRASQDQTERSRRDWKEHKMPPGGEL